MGALTDLVGNGRVRPVTAAADGLERLRQQMTPGQRWTAALASSLAIALLLYGQPTIRVAAPAPLAAAPTTAPAPPTATAPPTTPEAPGFSAPVLPPPTRQSRPVAPPPDTPPARPTEPAPLPEPAPAPAVPLFTALVPEAGVATVPRRDEASVAGTFLARASVNGAVLAYGSSDEDVAAACDAARERDAVLAATPLPPALRDCLLDADVLVVSHDEAAADAETWVSTRPSVAEALRAAAAWGSDGALRGALGLAVDPRLEPDVESVLADLERAGLDIVAVAYVTSARDAVRAFAQAGVETTVFALPTAVQREWIALSQLLMPAHRYVVVDAADAVTDADGFSPAFDGARYLGTALPTSEPTPEQQDCLDRYGSEPLTGAERTAVLRWCQLVDLAGAAAAATRQEAVPFVEALRSTTFASPVTTPLAPRDAPPSWGPTQVHELVWRAACSCWNAPTTTAATAARHQP